MPADARPNRTVEGLVGGIASATALGGLVMSAIKRDRGIKDWGHLIGRHGGMLDRLDSVCFAVPIFFHIIRFCWT